ncbi:MAG: MotA/TolQ/ExbB proton channel family protein [Candidatus Tenebribacter davisii]|jgi:chemotaxis protein MotA|nr:MotA/TolQ/ExbB proton channel family protein [Candidatus Tenebribacter davisii]
MRTSVIIGFLLGFGIIISVIFFKQEPSLYLNWAALAITLGGTISAVIIYFSPQALKNAWKSLIGIFKDKQYREIDLIGMILDISKQSKGTSFKSMIENESVKEIPFLAKGMNLVADGEDIKHIEEVLSRDSRSCTEKNIIAERVFRIAGSFAPMFGMMGTVIGLIAMLYRVKDPAAIPAAMGLALVTTFYGLVLAALIFKPLSGKIRDKNNTDTRVREIIIAGVISIKNNENTHKIKEKLLGYLH